MWTMINCVIVNAWSVYREMNMNSNEDLAQFTKPLQQEIMEEFVVKQAKCGRKPSKKR